MATILICDICKKKHDKNEHRPEKITFTTVEVDFSMGMTSSPHGMEVRERMDVCLDGDCGVQAFEKCVAAVRDEAKKHRGKKA